MLPYDGETWLEEFPAEYVERLAAIEESSHSSIASAWGKTDELRCDGDELLPIIHDLQRLARLALAERKGLFLWGSI